MSAMTGDTRSEPSAFAELQGRVSAKIHEPRIRIRDLDFFYGDNRALKNIELDMPDRQVTGLIGPSGCGKSTLLRVLNRMYDLYPGQRATGEVMMDGENIIAASIDLNRLRSRIGMVFQRPTPFPMSIYENIAFGVRLHERLSRAEMNERVEWSLSRAALWDEVKDRLKASALSLSGGQQQRLCIARAIAVRPQVVLFERGDQCARPNQHAEGGGTHRRAEARFHPGDGDPQHAAGGAHRRPGGIFLHGRTGGGLPGRGDVHRAQRTPHAGLHHRPLRLNGGTVMSEEAQHLIKSFDQDLNRLRDMMTEMGGIIESQVAFAAEAVMDRDADVAARAVEADPRVDALEREVEQFVIRMLALRQPLAGDLRQVVAALKITHDMERIGDYATNVAKRSIVLAEFALPLSLAGLGHMSRMVQENLKATIDAIGDNDAEKAREVWSSDLAVDDMYTAIFRELVTYMMEDPRNITPCTHLLFIAKNLERIGDHATNIAETVYYAVTGESLPDARPKGDSSAYAVVRPRE